jgi:exodeoxyribonuclease VII large subunit
MVGFQTKGALRQQKMMLEYADRELPAALKILFKKEKGILDGFEKSVALLGPEAILKRGFSITLIQGEAVLDAADLHPGDELETQFYRGKVKSIVKKTVNE